MLTFGGFAMGGPSAGITNMKKLLFTCVVGIATLLMGSTVSSNAQTQKKLETATEAPAKVVDPNRKLPFNAKVAAVDKANKTIKLGNRVFKVMPDTEMTKNDKPATLNDAVIGEIAGGSYKNNNGTLELVKIRFGPKTEAAEKGSGTTAKK
ncbi:MAG: hypothetical protein ACK4UN_01750 [Limisphaerales bacterium]